jgi:hypothetical protein
VCLVFVSRGCPGSPAPALEGLLRHIGKGVNLPLGLDEFVRHGSSAQAVLAPVPPVRAQQAPSSCEKSLKACPGKPARKPEGWLYLRYALSRWREARLATSTCAESETSCPSSAGCTAHHALGFTPGGYLRSVVLFSGAEILDIPTCLGSGPLLTGSCFAESELVALSRVLNLGPATQTIIQQHRKMNPKSRFYDCISYPHNAGHQVVSGRPGKHWTV